MKTMVAITLLCGLVTLALPTRNTRDRVLDGLAVASMGLALACWYLSERKRQAGGR